MHYAVLVLSPTEDSNIDRLLADYDENIEVEPYILYTREAAEKEGEKRLVDALAYWKEQYAKPGDKRTIYFRDIKRIINELSSQTGYEYMKDLYNADEDEDRLDEEGNICSTYNPDSKWDWYSFGGRFDDALRTKDGEHTYCGYAEDLNFGRDEERYEELLRWWEIAVDGDELREGEEKPFVLYKEEYYRSRYKDKETFADICSSPIFHAVVTPDGEWHEKGEMGWFSSSETPEESLEWDLAFHDRFLKEAIEQNYFCTVVDCHI